MNLRNLYLLSMPVLIVACRDIVVDAGDTTPPTLELSIAGAPVLRESGDTIEGAISSGTAFVLDPSSSATTATLIFVAKDEQSSIRTIRGNVELRFQCVARVIGGEVSKAATATFSVNTNTPNAAGSTVSDTEAALLEVSLNDAWERAGCDRWGQIIDVRTGVINNVVATVRGSASNNAIRAGRVEFAASARFADGSYRVSY